MHSTLQDTLLWTRKLQAAKGKRPLTDYFRMYATNKRLSEKDLADLGSLMHEGCMNHPGRISYHDRTDDPGRRNLLQKNFFYVSTRQKLGSLDEKGIARLNPHKIDMTVVGEHNDFTRRRLLTYVRAFPLLLDTEKVETAYLKHTGALFSYADPRTEYMIGMALLMLQASHAHYGPDVEPMSTRLLVPYGGGMLVGMLEPNLQIDTRHKQMVLGPRASSFVPTSQDEIKFAGRFDDYLPARAFTGPQEALYEYLIELFPRENTRQFDHVMNAYLTGETIPAAEQKSDALLKLEALMETPLWINATQRTGINRFKPPMADYTPTGSAF